MKSILYLLISLLLFSCSEKSVLQKFEIGKTIVELPVELKVNNIIQYNNGYICSFSNYKDTLFQIGCLDKSFKLDVTKTILFNKDLKYIQAIWTSGDTLFLIDAFLIKYWKNNRWYDFKPIPVEDVKNDMSNELNYPIYEDKEFIVRACCRGEFGGAVYFNDKKTNKVYSCAATCLNSIQKMGNSYYLTSSLPHMDGFSKIIKIDNPRKLYEIKDESQLVNCGWYDIYPDDSKDEEIKHPIGYDNGYETLFDTIGIQILGSFAYKNQLYQIFSDNRNTYLGYLNNRKPIFTDTLMNKVSYYGNVRDLKHNSNIFPILNRDFNGVILIDKNKIKVVEFKTKSSLNN